MRRCKPMLFGEIWSNFKSEHPEIERKITEGSIPDVWRRVAGEQIADATQVNFVRGVLYVKVGPSVLRHEIFINRENFRYEMNSILGSDLIGTIIVK
ncbi:MAG: DUF721 domain-containing protein [Tidjanibacter sp.]|nr:DUF721 domain-containing protein [Tidjanibacter sp.]MBQ3071033.1 DUF721 domain-containing protein [Tidjanibacter sp.]MBR1958648.1 DUF721 domain-containing protein [Tidjanibacter sp.]MBR2424741.1 DUF721 domain-containing protein [Tidjanibacter sp.]MBR7128833.1 DUF721 domain-containing protein [Tidjanibacter sp.]